jgi:hypothetical protein
MAAHAYNHRILEAEKGCRVQSQFGFHSEILEKEREERKKKRKRERQKEKEERIGLFFNSSMVLGKPRPC